MKKITFVLIFLFLVFGSSAKATIYKWVDDRGVINFTDDSDKVPPRYLDGVEKIVVPRKLSPDWSRGAGGKTGNLGTRFLPSRKHWSAKGTLRPGSPKR